MEDFGEVTQADGAGATTFDACMSKQWGSCAMGAASLGMAGLGVGMGKAAESLRRSAVGAPFFTGLSMRFGARVSGMISGTANASSVMYATTGTATGGNLGDNRQRS